MTTAAAQRPELDLGLAWPMGYDIIRRHGHVGFIVHPGSAILLPAEDRRTVSEQEPTRAPLGSERAALHW
jgi:hypothetical protein